MHQYAAEYCSCCATSDHYGAALLLFHLSSYSPPNRRFGKRFQQEFHVPLQHVPYISSVCFQRGSCRCIIVTVPTSYVRGLRIAATHKFSFLSHSFVSCAVLFWILNQRRSNTLRRLAKVIKQVKRNLNPCWKPGSRKNALRSRTVEHWVAIGCTTDYVTPPIVDVLLGQYSTRP